MLTARAKPTPKQVCAPRNALPETTLYVPLQFWFCRNPGLALPLIALQYHEVKLNVDLRPLDECLWAVSGTDSCTKATTAYQQSLVAASLYVDYIFLDTDERRRMAQNPHEYLIEQLQFTGDESVGSSSNKIKLNFNHPCKELVWVVQPDANVDYCGSFECNSQLSGLYGAQPFNYTDAVDVLPNSLFAYNPKACGADNTGADSTAQNVVDATADANVMFNAVDAAAEKVTDAGGFVLAETALDMHCWGENPVVTAKLQLNGQEDLNVKVRTSTLFSRTTTRATRTLVSTCTRLPSARKNTSHPARATSRDRQRHAQLVLAQRCLGHAHG